MFPLTVVLGEYRAAAVSQDTVMAHWPAVWRRGHALKLPDKQEAVAARLLNTYH